MNIRKIKLETILDFLNNDKAVVKVNLIISLSDTVDVGNGIYIKDGVQIEDHNANRGGYGVISAEQVIAFDSKIGLVKLLEKSEGIDGKISSLGFQNFQATPKKQ